MKASVLVRVDANPQIGWGHFYRCLSLAQMLKGDFEVAFAMSAPCTNASSILEASQIGLIKLPAQAYNTPDQKKHSDELQFDLTNYVKDFEIVVLDGYWFGEQYQRELRQFLVKIVRIEDEGQGEYIADLIINHAPGVNKAAYRLDVSCPMFALGTEYALLRPSFLKAAQNAYNPKGKIDKVLIAFGGSDYFNLTVKAASWVLEQTGLQIHIIIGASYPHHNHLNNLMEEFPERVTIKKNLNEAEMAYAMQSADIGIVPASGVLLECIACRLPVIAGVYANNQTSILKGFLPYDILENAGSFTEQALEKAWTALNQKNLAGIQQNQAKLIDGNSSERYKHLFECLN